MALNKPPEKESIYRISFIRENEIYEIYALSIANSNLFGFLEVEELVWDSQNAEYVIIDPSRDRLMNEFKDVVCTFIPLHNVQRIDIIEKTKIGAAKITPIKEGSNVMRFPTKIYTPPTQDVGID